MRLMTPVQAWCLARFSLPVIDPEALLEGAFAAISASEILQGGATGEDGFFEHGAGVAHNLFQFHRIGFAAREAARLAGGLEA